MQTADPRLIGVSVTGVEVDREIEYATIWVSAVEGSERSREIVKALAHAAGFLRSELASRIELRAFPRLRFKWDPTYERAESMEKLFDQMKQDDASRASSKPVLPAELNDESERDADADE
jgi:ribosome-binding factor A